MKLFSSMDVRQNAQNFLHCVEKLLSLVQILNILLTNYKD